MKHLLAAMFLLSQLCLPAWQWLHGRRDFAWDMFSYHVQCERVHTEAELARDFSSFAQLERVLAPGRLETYAKTVCARGVPTLHFDTACRDDRDQPLRPLVDPTRDWCR